METFKTSGHVETALNDDGEIAHHLIGRKGAEPITVHYVIEEYYDEGNSIYIDRYGSPWVKK